ncbi:dynein regulatory complex protein 9 [Centroberyx gerrardi]
MSAHLHLIRMMRLRDCTFCAQCVHWPVTSGSSSLRSCSSSSSGCRRPAGGSSRYERSGAELQLLQTHKLSQQAEGTLQDRIQLLQDRLEEERRVHEETQNFLSQQQMLLQQQLQQLAERSERLLEEKQQELNSLRSNKTSNLDLLQDLSRKFREAEQLVMEDRKEKEKLRRQQEREQTERSAVTTLQAWWRGCLVRRGLASCKTGKKTKEGKKKGKKKK